MEKKDITHFKEVIEKEIERIEKDLSSVAVEDSGNPGDWQAKGDDSKEFSSADPNDVADKIEDYNENTAILEQLETELNQFREALQRIENGTYGVCVISGEEIEKERLLANPAAKTCIKHKEEVV